MARLPYHSRPTKKPTKSSPLHTHTPRNATARDAHHKLAALTRHAIRARIIELAAGLRAKARARHPTGRALAAAEDVATHRGALAGLRADKVERQRLATRRREEEEERRFQAEWAEIVREQEEIQRAVEARRAREEAQWRAAKLEARRRALREQRAQYAKRTACWVEAQRAVVEGRLRKMEARRRAKEEALRRQAEEAARRAKAAEEEARRRAEEAARRADYERHRLLVEQHSALIDGCARGALATQIASAYEEGWQQLRAPQGPASAPKRRYCHVPFPVFFPPGLPPLPMHITYERVRAFVLSPQRASAKSPRARVIAEILRWHPDRFTADVLPRVEEGDHALLKEAAEVVVRHLNKMKDDPRALKTA